MPLRQVGRLRRPRGGAVHPGAVDHRRDGRAGEPSCGSRRLTPGVEIIGLHWLLAKTEGFYLTSPDKDVRQRTAAYLVALAEACHDFGGDLMVFGSPKQRSLLPGVTREQAFDWAADTFRQALPAIADFGVTLCMEPLSPAETDFVNTCDDALRLGGMVGHPNIVLHLDVKAM